MNQNKFGRLTFLKELPKRSHGCVIAEFLCDCGNIGQHVLYRVKKGSIKSCGCSRINPNGHIVKAFHDYKYSAKIRKLDFGIPFWLFKEIIMEPCTYCGEPATEKKPNGIDRILSDLGYIDGNVTAACWMCNRMKGSTHHEVFKKHIAKIYEREVNGHPN